MNVYFYNPCYLSADKFPILAEILKLKRVIDLTEPNTRNSELVKYYQSIAVYIRQESNIEQSIRDAVYKFNEPICKPKIEKGKFTGEFIVNDLYKNSNAYNPIYNLEKCNDDNILVLYTSSINKTLCYDFAIYSLRILKKYVKNNIYEKRICFCWIDSLFNYASMLYKNKFYSIRCEINPVENSIMNYYNPLLSYINLMLKLSVKNNPNTLDLYNYFLSEDGIQKMNSILECKFQQLFYTGTDDDLFEDDSSDIKSDLIYISENGGDWIFD